MKMKVNSSSKRLLLISLFIFVCYISPTGVGC